MLAALPSPPPPSSTSQILTLGANNKIRPTRLLSLCLSFIHLSSLLYFSLSLQTSFWTYNLLISQFRSLTMLTSSLNILYILL